MENAIVVKIDSTLNTEGFTQLKNQLHQITENTQKATDNAERFHKRIEMMGHISASLFVIKNAFETVTSSFSNLTSAYRTSEEAGARLDAVLKATGNASGFTGDELKKFASSLQDVTTHEDDATIAMMSVLSTFKMISGDTYIRAVQAIQDMSIVMGQDLKSSALQVGKALNMPKEGISALTRAGVQFTDAQKNMIEQFVNTGEVAKAQSIILEELETQFGGTSKAIAQTASGSLTQLQNKYGDLQEALGHVLLSIGQQTGLFYSIKSSIVDTTSALEQFTQNYEGTNDAMKELNEMTNASTLKEYAAHFIALGASFYAAPKIIDAVSSAMNAFSRNTLQSNLHIALFGNELEKAIVKTSLANAALSGLGVAFRTFAPTAILFAVTEVFMNWDKITGNIKTNLVSASEQLEKMTNNQLLAQLNAYKNKIKEVNEEIQKLSPKSKGFSYFGTLGEEDKTKAKAQIDNLKQQKEEYEAVVNKILDLQKKLKPKEENQEVVETLSDRFTRNTAPTEEELKALFDIQKEQYNKEKELAKKHAEEMKNFDNAQFESVVKNSSKSFKQLDSGVIDYDDIEKNAKSALEKMDQAYLSFYEATGSYHEAWEIKKAQLTEQYSMLTSSQLNQMLAAQEKSYFKSFTKQKSEAEEAAEAMYQAFNGIHRQLETSFGSFFDYTSDKFMEFGDLASSILNQIINEMIRMTIISPIIGKAGTATTAGTGLMGLIGGFFADGGYTGQGKKYEPRGIVHAGEYVIPQWMVNQNKPLIGALENTRIRGYANGGFVGGTVNSVGNTYINITNQSGINLDMQELSRTQKDNGDTQINLLLRALSNNPDVRSAVKAIR